MREREKLHLKGKSERGVSHRTTPLGLFSGFGVGSNLNSRWVQPGSNEGFSALIQFTVSLPRSLELPASRLAVNEGKVRDL
jgi:hypothetical protein